MKRLRVIYEGWGEHFDLGVLADDGQHLLFEYTQAARDRGLELSRFKLPLQSAAFGDFPAHQQRLPGLALKLLGIKLAVVLLISKFESRFNKGEVLIPRYVALRSEHFKRVGAWQYLLP